MQSTGIIERYAEEREQAWKQVSKRASALYKMNKGISYNGKKGYAAAQSKAYDEIIKGILEREEEEATEFMEAWEEDIQLALSGITGSHGFDFNAANEMVSDILYGAVDAQGRMHAEYPATNIVAAIEQKLQGEDTVNHTVFSSTGGSDGSYIAFEVYREKATGRIRDDWITDIDRIISVLKVDTSSLPGYNTIRGYFI